MNHPKMNYTYVGIDSHKETHTAVFLDCFFEKLGEITFENLPSDFIAFLKEADKFKLEGTTFIFGMEDVSQYGRVLLRFLLANNQTVKHVNAFLVAKERRSQNLDKSDKNDAHCVAQILLAKLGNLPEMSDEDERYHTLRTLVVRRDFLVRGKLALKTYLHSLLTIDFPNYHKFFAELDGKTSLAFFTKYPSPSMLNGISADELALFLHEHSGGTLGLERANEILSAIDTTTNESSEKREIRSKTLHSAINQLEYNIEEMKNLDADLIRTYRSFNTTLTSMSGLDIVSASQLLSCIGDIRKFSSPAKLARYAGIAPITHSSGKNDKQFASQRGNRELNSLFYNLAVRLIITFGPKHKSHNPFFYDYYHRKLSEGKTKRQALKCVQRRLVNIIWTMLTNNEDYVNPPMVERKRKEVKDENSK